MRCFLHNQDKLFESTKLPKYGKIFVKPRLLIGLSLFTKSSGGFTVRNYANPILKNQTLGLAKNMSQKPGFRLIRSLLIPIQIGFAKKMTVKSTTNIAPTYSSSATSPIKHNRLIPRSKTRDKIRPDAPRMRCRCVAATISNHRTRARAAAPLQEIQSSRCFGGRDSA